MHSIAGGRDSIVYLQSYYPMKYDDAWPRIELIWTKDKNGIGHTDVLSYMRSTFEQKYGFKCVNCEKTDFAHSFRSSFSVLNFGSCLPCQISQAEKKINDVTSGANTQSDIYFTQNGRRCHFE